MSENRKYAFDLISVRREKIEKKLIKNLVFQILCVIVGLSYVYHYDDVIGKPLLTYLNIKPELALLVIPILLVYLFIEFGYAFGQYLFINRTYKNLFSLAFKDFHEENLHINDSDFKMSFESLNFFGQFQARNKSWQGSVQTAISIATTTSVLLAGHFTAYGTIGILISNKWWVVAVKIVIAAFLLFFYWNFCMSNRKNHFISERLVSCVYYAAWVVTLVSISGIID